MADSVFCSQKGYFRLHMGRAITRVKPEGIFPSCYAKGGHMTALQTLL